MIQGCNVKFKLAGLAEFPKTSAKTDEIRSSYRDRETHRSLRNVKHSIPVQSEAMWLVWTIDEVHKILAL